VATWPQGEAGWTVVLASERSRSRAAAKARRFSNAGTSGVGILDSDDFASLAGGYWVVYAGRYGGRRAAEDALQGVDAPDAYVRQVTPR
ncbi:MAG TPA: SPOR domain-containing protein, partial [Solirubrobacteraceae bacterium]|nr:SPOR domain-containing protein [Solirubrobacteraceae bacterium]